ncbi:MAG: RNA-binding protein, partial [Nitrospira sp. SB0672_bin_25]|nr:RNA-binding protein [Nitrospira sp. SB0672_bin_25]
TQLDGRTLTVNQARPQEARPGGGGRGGFGGRGGRHDR